MSETLAEHTRRHSRHHFAGLAMQGLCTFEEVYERCNFEDVARLSVAYADALIAELAKESGEDPPRRAEPERAEPIAP